MTAMRVLAVAALIISFAAADADTRPSARAVADAYLAAILDDDWSIAHSLWLPADLAASRRLDIRYEGQPFKLDSASSLVLECARIQAGEISVSVGEIEADGDLARIHFRLQAPDGFADARSFALRSEDGWLFVAPSTALASGWPSRQTEFLDLRVEPPLQISEEAVRTLDRFVADTCERLALPASRVETLRTAKIGYLYCAEATVADIVGAPTRGAALLQTDAVVTSEPCHLHELAHLLVNYALQDLPLFTLPIMQEGAAVAFGGRWGRSPEVMSGLGRFALGEGLLTVDELLTFEDFHHNSADLTYAPSGVFTAFLIDLIGGERYLDLYLILSGEWPGLARLDRATIRARIRAVAEMDWPVLMEELDEYVDDLSCGGVLVGGARGTEVVAEGAGSTLAVVVTGDDESLHWRIEAEKGTAVGAVLFHDSKDAPVASRLFAEQFPERAQACETLAVVFSPEEIGVYDFRRDLLTAKYVAGFCPDQVVAMESGTVLEFSLRRELFPKGEWDLEIVSDESRGGP